MNIEIPDFLLEMSKQINTQDNRITAEPIWQVRCKRLRVTAEGFGEFIQIVDTEDDYHIVASSANNDSMNEQIVKHLDCDPEDLPVMLEKWVDDREDFGMSGEEKIDFFIDNFDCDYDLDDLGYSFEKFTMEEYEDIVKGAFLTEADAERFIQRKQHDYPKLYTYVESMTYCPQMIELRKWIMSLSKENS